jgi:hypothetical protein
MPQPDLISRTAWKRIGPASRREVFRLANLGQRHPDPLVCEAAYAWATDKGWDRLANRLPGWLLPAVGAVFGAVFLLLQMPLLAIGAVVVILFGLLGWASTAAAATVRAVYAAPIDHSPAE